MFSILFVHSQVSQILFHQKMILLPLKGRGLLGTVSEVHKRKENRSLISKPILPTVVNHRGQKMTNRQQDNAQTVSQSVSQSVVQKCIEAKSSDAFNRPNSPTTTEVEGQNRKR